ncbi:MAG: metal ABC transporter ATP-binding protein [Patescibacteria group bacterium]|nr:metal ABC transporter ATP-binding protein [Patescibacteria group bacterium]
MEKIISVEDLSFRYGGNEAVSDVSFSVEQGDYIALVGHNGSGKTTLIKLLLGILKPSTGSVFLFGKDLHDFTHWDKVGYLPQNIGLFNPLFPATVAEVVALGLVSQKKFPKRLTAEDAKSVNQALTQMDIAALSNKLIGELSGGQIQRTLLARAIVNQPELLILDEPVSAVDTETRKDFYSYTARLSKEKKTTIILITHDIGHSGGYANKLLFLDKRIIFYGKFGEFCISKEMKEQFGAEIQHIMCHQH